MDLPPPSQQDNTTPPLSSGSTSASSSMTSLDKQVEDTEEDTETLGDHFAKQNQSTLKKNEKFQESSTKKIDQSVSSSSESSKASGKGSMDDVVLRIEEANECDGSRLSTGSNKSTSSLKIEMEKSPIPLRNTQKFVSKFADLKLTGGCSTTLKSTVTTPTNPLAAQPEKAEKERTSFTFGSFKPTISMKPQLLKKKKSIFLQAHSSPSPSTSPGPSDGQH